MSIPFFNSVLKTLGKRINYDAVVNYAGNSFAKNADKIIRDANPMIHEQKNKGLMSLLDNIKTVTSDEANKGLDWMNEI